MSETTDKTQPTKPQGPIKETQPVKAAQKPIAETQPMAPREAVEPQQPIEEQAPPPPSVDDPSPLPEPAKPKKRKRFVRILLNTLVFLLIVGGGIFSGYQSGVGMRTRAQDAIINQQLGDQYSRALVDIQFGNFSAAKQRLEYIISIDPVFPGAQEKLTEVLVLSSIPTATPFVSPTPELIMDDTNYDSLLAQAQQLIAAGQWQNALTVLDTLRQKDPTFHTARVDGMYYFALRNLGVDLIKGGNLEGGIYQLTLAERFGPLDNIALALRDNARFYLTAASFWELDWKLATEYFAQLNGSGMWDGTMTATERYFIASMRYGDQLYTQGDYCGAVVQYQNAQAVGALDNDSARNLNDAYLICYPPTATPEPTVTLPIETPGGAPTEPPPTAPTP